MSCYAVLRGFAWVAQPLKLRLRAVNRRHPEQVQPLVLEPKLPLPHVVVRRQETLAQGCRELVEDRPRRRLLLPQASPVAKLLVQSSREVLELHRPSVRKRQRRTGPPGEPEDELRLART